MSIKRTVNERIDRARNSNDEKELLKLSRDPSINVKGALIYGFRSSLPYSVWESICNNKDSRIIEEVSTSRRCPPELLDKMARNNHNREIKLNVAHNISTPISTLEYLSHDPDTQVINQLAWNDATPVSLLLQIYDKFGDNGRRGLAFREDMPKEIHIKLMNMKDEHITRALLKNPTLESDILYNFSIGKEVRTHHRRYIVKNPNTRIMTLINIYLHTKGKQLKKSIMERLNNIQDTNSRDINEEEQRMFIKFITEQLKKG